MGRLRTIDCIVLAASGTGLTVLVGQAFKQRLLRLVLRPGLIRLQIIVRKFGSDSRDSRFNRFLELL